MKSVSSSRTLSRSLYPLQAAGIKGLCLALPLNLLPFAIVRLLETQMRPGILLIVREGLFLPDESRAKRWPVKECKSLHGAMSFLARRKRHETLKQNVQNEKESPGLEDWTFFGSEDEVSISSASDVESALFGAECNTSDEDREAEISAPIVGASVAQEIHYSLSDVSIFKHVKSGCCHVAKSSEVVEEDGDMTVLRCGKIATRNFEKVTDIGNFMPYKCTRCFAAVSDA